MPGATPRVLVLGGTGMLGGMLWSRLSGAPGWRVRRSQRRDPRAPGYFDALAPGEGLDALLAADGGTDFVLNAIGLTKPEIREDDADSRRAAEAVNAELPRRLAAAAARAGARVIHLSTDGVFSGKAGPYDEGSVADPEDLYGRTKLAGEIADPRVLTLRCSIVGPDPEKGRGLFEWFRRLPSGSRAKGYTDQLWNGVTTPQVADLCRRIVDGGLFDTLTAVAPVRHFCPNRPVTKHELLRLFASALGSGVAVDPAESGVRLDRTLRSRWSDLNELAGAPRDMADAVTEMVRA
ncbi:MAG: sugar nucleotide-binding protein, partial [Elusimicrobia bacterium]|nr:sugar nucleotide-binding protein [Elusimicrobiota bacterium]